ncbi:MAG: hypothetical protein M5U27_14585 [Gaiella sp.]|nr:hypothetical protein [Gaiella sp.]
MSTPWIVAFLALVGLVVLETIVLVGLLRRVSGALEQVEARLATASALPEVAGVTPGSVVPDFSVTDEAGRNVHSSALVSGATIFLLVASDCSACKYLARELEGVGDAVDGMPLYVLMQNSPASGHTRYGGGTVLYDAGLEAARAFRSAATPVAFLVDHGGFVLDRTIPDSLADIQKLVARQKGGVLASHA